MSEDIAAADAQFDVPLPIGSGADATHVAHMAGNEAEFANHLEAVVNGGGTAAASLTAAIPLGVTGSETDGVLAVLQSVGGASVRSISAKGAVAGD